MQELFTRYLRNQCSLAEVRLLLREIAKEKNRDLFKRLADQQLNAELDLTTFNENKLQDFLANTYQNVKIRIVEKKIEKKVKPFKWLVWYFYSDVYFAFFLKK